MAEVGGEEADGGAEELQDAAGGEGGDEPELGGGEAHSGHGERRDAEVGEGADAPDPAAVRVVGGVLRDGGQQDSGGRTVSPATKVAPTATMRCEVIAGTMTAMPCATMQAATIGPTAPFTRPRTKNSPLRMVPMPKPESMAPMPEAPQPKASEVRASPQFIGPTKPRLHNSPASRAERSSGDRPM